MTDLPETVRNAMYDAAFNSPVEWSHLADVKDTVDAALSALSAAGYTVAPTDEIARLRAENESLVWLADTTGKAPGLLWSAGYEHNTLTERVEAALDDRDAARAEVADLRAREDAALALCDEAEKERQWELRDRVGVRSLRSALSSDGDQ
jgi:hypothetical protein